MVGLEQAAGAIAALVAVVLLVLLSGRAARLLPVVKRAEGQVLIRLRGTLALDTRRRLHLVEADGQQALVLTGGGRDVLIAWHPPVDGTQAGQGGAGQGGAGQGGAGQGGA